MTIPELFAAFDAAAQIRRRAFEVATLAAWQTARFMRTDPKKHLPTLKKLFGEFGDGTPKRQTPKQMRGMLMQLSQHYGIPMTSSAHG